MALTDSQSARQSATIAENAAAEAKSYSDLAQKAKDFSDEAKVSADDAAASAELAASAQSDAELASNTAQTSATAAQASANSAALSANDAAIASNVYLSLSDAQTAITAGTIPLNGLFSYNSPNGNNYIDQGQNVSGVATPTGKSYPSSDYVISVNYAENVNKSDINTLRNQNPSVQMSPSNYALWWDEAGNVPAKLNFGMLETYGAGNNLSKSVAKNLLMDNIPLTVNSNTDVPYVWDEAGNIALKFTNGLINGYGIHPDLLKKSGIFNYTDGRKLWPWRAKRSSIKSGVPAVINALLVGDSWVEWKAIPQAIANLMYAEYTKAGEGWISFNVDGGTTTNNNLNNVAITYSGFTVYDASNGSAPTQGCSFDGFALMTSNTFATLQLDNVECTDIRIYYLDGNGTFNYRVDSGSFVPVTGGGTGTLKHVDIPTQAAGMHSLRINMTGNTGNVVIYGFYSKLSSNGVIINKAGNGGMTAPMYGNVLPYIGGYTADLNPDVIIMVIGINDYRTNVNITTFYNSYLSWINAYKSALPNASFILVAPPQPNVSGATDMSVFNQTIRLLSVAVGADFYSLYEAFPSTYAPGFNAGLWFNDLHLNAVGGYFLADQLKNKLLE
ncbi:SGNH/GDSL hydrolase family protein [Serratia nevei]|uniref:SGNH/GDSL hydrolase family protein n=1 Tax=Serratia nevei TaxID=2703794 RepID=UPI00249CB5CF|nr:SGNH/GDSL hydrolase family protein [Serratia nevei]MDI3148981.1 SGNH/GDSL hydrolase family protein [Serratia nevei]